ncbi:glycerophosphodiester phosphodiesterase [candidate division KSB1 bacterium]|nr:glycerophosphodiester phosphodiesterase [candidate division KSB1 bacterium]
MANKPDEKLWRDFWHCAHRGASAWAPENTMAALRLALQMGANSLELDVHLSADGNAVLLHDDTLDRTTDGRGPVQRHSLEHLRTLDAGSWFAPEFAGEPIPTLQEVLSRLEECPLLNIEIKGGNDVSRLAEVVTAEIRKQKAVDRVLVTSFDATAIQAVKAIDSKIAVGLISFKRRPDLLQGEWEAVSCHHALVDEAFLDSARQAGKKVLVWTVNETEAMKDLLRLGVDGIITNYPDRLASAREDSNL